MNLKKLFALAFAVVCFLCFVTGFCAQADDAHIYYVSEISGSDSNDGKTADTAFRTIKAAVKAIGKADGTVKIMDTVYWSFDSKKCNVPEHTGTITFEGMSADNVESQIIDYSEMNDNIKESADLLVSGPTVFKNVTLRSHFNKALFTNSKSLTLSGTIKHLNDEGNTSSFVVYIGNPSAHSTDDSLIVDADVSISAVNFGYNFSHKLMGKTSFKLLRGNAETITVCNKRAPNADVDIRIYNGNVGTFSLFNGGRISGRLTMLVNTSCCPQLSAASDGIPGNSLVIYSDDGDIMDISGDNTLSLLSDKTALIARDGAGEALYSPYGGSVILDDGIYSVSTEDKVYYTNDGNNITVFEPVKIDLERMSFENSEQPDYINCGWTYKGKLYGPANNSVVPAGTVLEAQIRHYDPSDDEFGIVGCAIRLEGEQALRFVTSKKNSFNEKFDVLEYGTLVAPSSYFSADELYLDAVCELGIPCKVPAVNTLEKTYDGILYTACLVGIPQNLYGQIYSARSYAVCKGANGQTFAVYSDIYSTSVGRVARIAKQNENAEKFDKIISEWGGQVVNNIKEENNEIYQTAYAVGQAGTHVRELEIDSGRADGKVTEIALITDMHLHLDQNFINAADNAMKIANLCDATVLCGDNIDSATHVSLLQKHVFNVDKSVMLVMGNHEILTETSADQVANRKIVDGVVPHDTRYFSKMLHDRVLLVTVDDCEYVFTEEQCNKLEADIARARENDYPVLLFYHAIITDIKIGENERMYNIIKNNADVIKAVFNGHYHVDDKYTIPGTYTDENGETVKRDIPCYLLRGNAEDGEAGNILKIIVE